VAAQLAIAFSNLPFQGQGLAIKAVVRDKTKGPVLLAQDNIKMFLATNS
jgi:hypothetical protein